MNKTIKKADVISMLAEHLGLDEHEVTEEKTLAELGADSLDRVEICMAIEDEFAIEIRDEDWTPVATVADVFTVLGKYDVQVIQP